MRTVTSARSRLSILAAVAALGVVSGCSQDGPEVSGPTAPATSSTSTASDSSSSSESSEASSSSTSSTSSSTSSSSSSTTTPPSASSPASSAAPGSQSDLVKFCDAAGADAIAKNCKTPSTTVSGSIVYCSVDLPNSVRGSVKATLYRNGSLVYSGNANRTAATGSLMLNYSVGKLQLPGGTYSCTFSAGSQTWRGDATVAGPAGRASQQMACDGDTMYTTAGISHCTSNSATLSSPGSLGCSALVTDLLGKRVEARLNTPQGSRTITLSNKFNLGSAIVYLKAPKSSFSGTFPTGSYSCNFLVDGQTVSTVPFSVS